MTDKVLINAGYKESDVPKTEQYANRFFQKKIKDNNGVKYYIDVYEYELNDSYSYEFILVTQKDKFWVKTKIYAIECMDLDEIEYEIEDIWKKCKFNYYELYEKERTTESYIDEMDLYAKRQLEILEELKRCVKVDCDFYLEHDECYEFLDYILNLQAEINEANDNAIWWHNRYNAIKKQIETK